MTNLGYGPEEPYGIVDGQLKQSSNGFIVPFDGQNLVSKSFPVTYGTAHKDVSHELHFDPFVTEALAILATTETTVEGER